MKKLITVAAIAASVCSAGVLADNLNVKIDNGVNFAKLRNQGGANDDIGVTLQIKREGSQSGESSSTSGILKYLTNTPLLQRKVGGLTVFNYEKFGSHVYDVDIRVVDETKGSALYDCQQRMTVGEFTPEVNYVLDIHSLAQGNCTLRAAS